MGVASSECGPNGLSLLILDLLDGTCVAYDQAAIAPVPTNCTVPLFNYQCGFINGSITVRFAHTVPMVGCPALLLLTYRDAQVLRDTVE